MLIASRPGPYIHRTLSPSPTAEAQAPGHSTPHVLCSICISDGRLWANTPTISIQVDSIYFNQPTNLYRGLCQAAGQRYPDDPRRPLHRCDFYRSPEAGRVLGRLMEKGSSRPWQDTLEEAIGEFRLDGSALREYFRPLEDWLRTENLRFGEIVGWSYDGDYCKRSIETAGLQVFGNGFYNSALSHQSSIILIAVLFLITPIFIF
ncbi:hypothetical protein PV325_005491 [Microctonus aethiopoides]|uniref:Uncharacterized protein n=1 Tax=Microctonus aethiopoides TaxID=144406 RepID=A0AA39FR61_9HYME|nr:hypothetical protein PV325_005491 [Microctonus aethiopoides]KAK0174183.1 hypothetical protein PV328_007292 [Microctonus aethiopoides]